MMIVLGGLWHFYKSAAKIDDLGNAFLGLNVANLVIYLFLKVVKFFS
jgi:hypothetical protein